MKKLTTPVKKIFRFSPQTFSEEFLLINGNLFTIFYWKKIRGGRSPSMINKNQEYFKKAYPFIG
jgi:hypothetical protein